MSIKETTEAFKLWVIDEAFNKRGEYAPLYADQPLLLHTANDVADWFSAFIEYHDLEISEGS